MNEREHSFRLDEEFLGVFLEGFGFGFAFEEVLSGEAMVLELLFGDIAFGFRFRH